MCGGWVPAPLGLRSGAFGVLPCSKAPSLFRISLSVDDSELDPLFLVHDRVRDVLPLVVLSVRSRFLPRALD